MSNTCIDCPKRATTDMSNGDTYCDDHYFARLHRVTVKASNAVADAQIERARDESRYPFLDINRWSWRTYENWKRRQANDD